MKVSVRVLNDWVVVPCKNGQDTIAWLGDEAVRRYVKNKPATTRGGCNVIGNVLELRTAQAGSLLDPDDHIQDVVDDNDFIITVLESDEKHKDIPPVGFLSRQQIDSRFEEATQYMTLDGNSLSSDDLVQLGKGVYKIKLSESAWNKVAKARALLDEIISENKVAYGLNTGFGKFARVVIPAEKLSELQRNLIRSHAAGVGEPLSQEKTRMLMALRINVLAKGYSGITTATLQQYIAAFNASCLPYVPEKGTVGASGDLAPLSHLALGMIGEGKMWSPKSGWADANTVLEAHGLQPIKLGPKEGLALINGTQLITSITVLALERAAAVARQADVVAALTLEVLKGTTRAFDSDIHAQRPHKGQQEVAARLRALLHSEYHPSEIAESHRFCDRVQDAYTMRCCPQAADFLAIGIHELANISERRIERLCNPAYSDLPAFLVNDGGLNSGFMIAHCTAASLVSENKVLTHPSSVDSLTTSGGTEDHVSMGGFAARKALQVVEHVEQVVAIELLAACQGIEFLRPLKTTKPLEAVYQLVRSYVKAWDKDRYMAPDIEQVTKLLREERIWHTVKPYINNYECEILKETRMPSPTATTLDTSKRRKLEEEY
ncbi:histidine ammonia-lyase-like isoform X2 [Ptychodera flava]|uniref:histidine ammonia-lyase-like isoform X2 n=1 Tax=Ptychodera flava TaxID=63121 RepID=UPI00396A45FA